MADDTTKDRSSRLHPLSWIGWILAAILLGAILMMAHHMAWVRARLTIAEGDASQTRIQLQHADQVLNVLTSPDARHVVLTDNHQPIRPVGQVSWLPSKGSLVFFAGGLRPLPADKTYELWLIPAQGKAPIAAGLFRPDADHGATVVLTPVPTQIQAQKFMVTIEPLRGSETPSLPIVMQGQ